MEKSDKIYTLSLLQMLSEGKLDPGRGKFYNDQCYVLTAVDGIEVNAGKSMFRTPTRLDCFVFVINAEGKLVINCNMQQITIEPRTAFVAPPGTITQVIEVEGSKTSVIMCSEKFMREMNLSLQNLLPHISSLHGMGTLQLTEEQYAYLQHHIETLAESIAQPTTLSYYHEIVHNSIRAMAYSFISLLILYVETKEKEGPTQIHSHEEELFRRFLQLVSQHFRTERRISFYAEQMHLTPKYMSSIIRHATGHSPAEWITQNVMLEAKNLLRYTNMSIQQISYELHFPNQSFFGRWFKSKAGLSPKDYRNSR